MAHIKKPVIRLEICGWSLLLPPPHFVRSKNFVVLKETALSKHIDIQISSLLVGLACCPHSQFTSLTVHHQKWAYLPTHKHLADWAEKIVPARTNPPPSFLIVSLVPLFIICGQTVKLKPIGCLLN